MKLPFAKKHFLLTFLLYLTCQVSYAQITFQQSYGISAIDFYNSVKQTSDNGYVILGSDLFDFTGSKVILIKTDTVGAVVWARKYGEFFSGYTAEDVIQTSDGGYLITGSLGGDIVLIKTDGNGVEQWSRDYGGSNTESPTQVKETSDGGFLVSGSTWSFSAKDSSNFYLFKTNNLGVLQWDQAYEISTVDDEVASAVEELPNGYVIVGSTPEIFGSDTTRDGVVIKTDEVGVPVWSRSYGSDTYEEEFYDVDLMSTGELLVTGSSNEPTGGLGNDIVLLKLDTATGAVNFSSAYDMGFAEIPQSVQETSDGGLAAIGFLMTFIPGPWQTSAFLLKTNSTGTIQIGAEYMAQGSIFINGEETTDGGFVLGGVLMNTISGSFDLTMYKTDNMGSTVCNDTNFTTLQYAYVPPVTTPTVALYTGGSSSGISPTDNTFTPDTTLFCLNTACSPPPAPTLTATDTDVCESESGVTYTATAGYDTYAWTVVGGTITGGAGTNNITVDWGTGPNGTVDLVIDSSGCAGILSTENVSIADPVPTLSTTDISVCEAETGVTYAAQLGFSTYTWTVSGGTIASGAGTNSITVDWGTPGAGTVDLTVEDAFGCTGSLSATENVTINNHPVTTLSVTDTVVCENQTGVTYTTQTGFTTYSWGVIGGTVASGAGTNSITIDWGTSGTGTVSLSIVDTNGCPGSLSPELVSVNPNPIPTLTTTSSSVCDSQTGVVFTTDSFYSSYTWAVSGGSISSGTGTDSINVDWGSPGGGTVDLTVIDTNGCSGALSSTETVTINISPSPSLTVTDTLVCESETGLTYTTQSGYSGYTWTVTGGTISSGQGTDSITIDWGISGGGTVDLVVDSNGCNGSLSATETVTILAAPVANITPSGSTFFCTGQSVQLTSDTATSYLWILDSVSTGFNTQSINVTAGGGYQVVVTNSAGCPDTSAVSNLVENTSPTANITASGSIDICGGDSVILTADTASIYAWFMDGSPTGQSTQSITVLVSGDYQVAVSNAFCQDTSAITTVTVNLGTVLTITGTLVDSSNCGSSDGSITGTMAGGITPFTYEWVNSGSTVVGGDSANLVDVPADTYTLTMTDSTGCTATSTFTVFDIGAPPTPTAGPDAMYCQGDPIADLTATGSGGTLIWYSDLPLTDSIGTGSPFTSGATSSAVFYVTETIAGCESTADFVAIVVNTTPAMPVAGTDSAYCEGDPIADLTATGSGGIFTWYSDSLLTDSIGTGSPFTSGATITDTFYVTETLLGCPSLADAVILTITSTPVGLVATGSASYCVGDPVADLTATGAGGTITWYSNAGLTDTVFTGSPFASGASTDTIFYVTETSNGCASATDNVTLSFNPQPIVVLTSSSNSICLGGDVTLTATGADTYLWSTTETTASITVSPTVNTVYNVIGTTAGCSSIAVSTSVSIFSGGILAGFSAGPVTGSIPLTVSFTDTSVGAISWQWDFSYDSLAFNDESSLQNPEYMYTEGGIYLIMLLATDANGCSDTATYTLVLDVKEEVFIPNLFSPNGDASNDILYVRGNGIDELHLVIYDRWGEKIFEGEYAQVWALEDTYPSGIGWDGTFNEKPMNPAVFVYVLTGSFISGETIDQKGNITLVR